MSNLQFKNITSVCKKFVGKIQTTENIRISVKKEIAEVLSVGCESLITSYECSNNQVAFYGKTNVRFLYDDGDGIVSANYNADFTADMQSDLLDVNSKVVFDVITVDTKVDTTANTATLVVLLEISAYAYVYQSTPCLVEVEEGFAERKSVSYLSDVDVYQLPFVIDEDLTATSHIDTVLLAESSVCVSHCQLKDGVLTAKGNATVRLTYITDGRVATDTLPFDFEREVDATGIACDNLCVLALARATKVRLSITDEAINDTFSVDISCALQVEAQKLAMENIVTDCYATDCDFDLERESVCLALPCQSLALCRQFDCPLPTQREGIQSAVNVNAVVTKCTPQKGFVTVDGVAQATLLFADGSEVVELPFSQKIEGDFTAESLCYAKATMGKFEVEGGVATVGLCIALQWSQEVFCNLIVGAEAIPFDKKQLPAMEICIAHKGETLWQLGKSLHLSTEDILAINTNLTDPLASDTKIVVFNKI